MLLEVYSMNFDFDHKNSVIVEKKFEKKSIANHNGKISLVSTMIFKSGSNFMTKMQ